VQSYVPDALGTVRAVVDPYGVQSTYGYTAFGKLRYQTGPRDNPYLFTGRVLDKGTGDLHYRARQYSPELGRFLAADRMAPERATYGYAAGNPLRFTDPLGLWEAEVPNPAPGAVGWWVRYNSEDPWNFENRFFANSQDPMVSFKMSFAEAGELGAGVAATAVTLAATKNSSAAVTAGRAITGVTLGSIARRTMINGEPADRVIAETIAGYGLARAGASLLGKAASALMARNGYVTRRIAEFLASGNKAMQKEAQVAARLQKYVTNLRQPATLNGLDTDLDVVCRNVVVEVSEAVNRQTTPVLFRNEIAQRVLGKELVYFNPNPEASGMMLRDIGAGVKVFSDLDELVAYVTRLEETAARAASGH
jgi:RHS repeat-associated protein